MATVDKELSTFPFLFGGTFIEALITGLFINASLTFPFLFGGTFIEACYIYL